MKHSLIYCAVLGAYRCDMPREPVASTYAQEINSKSIFAINGQELEISKNGDLKLDGVTVGRVTAIDSFKEKPRKWL